MNAKALLATWALAVTLPLTAYAYESGSTGVDGVFNPTVDVEVALPASGIFNFTDVNIPAGVTVTFTKNVTNTPVVFLVSGDATIDGTIDINGFNGGATGSAAGGIGGAAGPGGFAGGHGGLRSHTGAPGGSNGLGPGGGGGAPNSANKAGGGGGFGSAGEQLGSFPSYGAPGPTYGSGNLRTLIGGSGGGGGSGAVNTGAGGGGGGGAIAIAVSGILSVNGTISARGGNAGTGYETNPNVLYGYGGSGSGGAIRLIATTLQGEGTITASANTTGVNGGNGRIRLEAETMLRGANSAPSFTFSAPNPIFYANVPSVRITTIGGVAVPAGPTGFRDVVLPGLTTNPVTIGFETTNVPLGTTIGLKALPERGLVKSATSSAVTGSNALGTATADIDLPSANSTLFGSVTFTIVITDNSQSKAYAKYAKNEPVEKVRYSVNSDGLSEATMVTASGREYTWPANTININ